MKKTLFTLFLYVAIGTCSKLHAQILKVTTGSDLTILGGTVFSADSLVITPSADYTLSNTNLDKASTVIHTIPYNYIARVYQFSGVTNPFSGSVQINYMDGAELNSIPESGLTLNIFDGTSWNAYPATSRNPALDYVLTTGVTSGSINEVTLADPTYILPIVWASFTATKLNSNVRLKWTTEQELNTRNFTVQYSIDGINWSNLTSLPAAGNNAGHQYSYVHTSPANGNNYYRIMQTDMDDTYNFSVVRTINFTAEDLPYSIKGNPVTNGILSVQVNKTTGFSLYTDDGKLLLKRTLRMGAQNIDVSRYAKGSYLIIANGTTQKILIQ